MDLATFISKCSVDKFKSYFDLRCTNYVSNNHYISANPFYDNHGFFRLYYTDDYYLVYVSYCFIDFCPPDYVRSIQNQIHKITSEDVIVCNLKATMYMNNKTLAVCLEEVRHILSLPPELIELIFSFV